MFHYIEWKWQKINDGELLIVSWGFGVQVSYSWGRTEGAFFLFPYMDENLKTISYFAFNTLIQKQSFAQMLKISWIGPKTAFGIANMDVTVLQNAIATFDVKTMQSIPWVGPKTAKRLLVELKSTITTSDVAKLVIDEKLLKSIVSSMKTYWYDANMVKKHLKDCPHPLDKEHLQDIMKWLISNL